MLLEADGDAQDGEEEEDGGATEVGDVVHGEETGGDQEHFGGDDQSLLENHTGLMTDFEMIKEEHTGKSLTEQIDPLNLVHMMDR